LEAAHLLEASPDYRVLRRFVPRDQYAEIPAGVVPGRALVIDTETTGVDTRSDALIELPASAVRESGDKEEADVVSTQDSLCSPGAGAADSVLRVGCGSSKLRVEMQHDRHQDRKTVDYVAAGDRAVDS
jgi:hypothetical protein